MAEQDTYLVELIRCAAAVPGGMRRAMRLCPHTADWLACGRFPYPLQRFESAKPHPLAVRVGGPVDEPVIRITPGKTSQLVLLSRAQTQGEVFSRCLISNLAMRPSTERDAFFGVRLAPAGIRTYPLYLASEEAPGEGECGLDPKGALAGWAGRSLAVLDEGFRAVPLTLRIENALPVLVIDELKGLPADSRLDSALERIAEAMNHPPLIRLRHLHGASSTPLSALLPGAADPCDMLNALRAWFRISEDEARSCCAALKAADGPGGDPQDLVSFGAAYLLLPQRERDEIDALMDEAASLRAQSVPSVRWSEAGEAEPQVVRGVPLRDIELSALVDSAGGSRRERALYRILGANPCAAMVFSLGQSGLPGPSVRTLVPEERLWRTALPFRMAERIALDPQTEIQRLCDLWASFLAPELQTLFERTALLLSCEGRAYETRLLVEMAYFHLVEKEAELKRSRGTRTSDGYTSITVERDARDGAPKTYLAPRAIVVISLAVYLNTGGRPLESWGHFIEHGGEGFADLDARLIACGCEARGVAANARLLARTVHRRAKELGCTIGAEGAPLGVGALAEELRGIRAAARDSG